VTRAARKLEARVSVRVDEDLEARVERVALELAAQSALRVTTADAARVLLELGLEEHARRSAARTPMGTNGYQRPSARKNRSR